MTESPRTTSQVARELGVSPSLVRTWISYLNQEVQRNEDGHRVFGPDDVEQLRALKAWLDSGQSLKAFRAERQDEGAYDPRTALRGAFRRLRELDSQQAALLDKQAELAERMRAEREALAAMLAAIAAAVAPEGAAAPPPPSAVEPVLKQLMTALLARRGTLELLGEVEEDGIRYLAYRTPDGRQQRVPDVCRTPSEKRLLETVLGLLEPAEPESDRAEIRSPR